MNAPQLIRRTCPVCQSGTHKHYCCGVFLLASRRPWAMRPEYVKLVHVVKARKGLDEETYRLRLQAVGVASCKDLGREAFRTFIRELGKLPDSPAWRDRQSPEARSARG